MEYIKETMQEIEKNTNKKVVNIQKEKDAKILSLEYGMESKVETKQDSKNLSKDLARSLMNLIDKVNEDGVSPETVNASCNAASQIYKILRLNFEMKKEGF